MMNAIKLFVKSEKQYQRTCVSLNSLGLRSFLLGGYQCNKDYGITVFLESGTVLRYTDGCGTAATYQPEYVHTKRKEFIEVVTRVLGESK